MILRQAALAHKYHLTGPRGRNRKEASTHLCPRPLSPNRQPQRLTTTSVRPRLLQPLDIIQILSAEVILDLHVGKRGRDIEDLLVGQLADLAGRVDVEAGEQMGGCIPANAEEGFEGFLVLIVRFQT